MPARLINVKWQASFFGRWQSVIKRLYLGLQAIETFNSYKIKKELECSLVHTWNMHSLFSVGLSEFEATPECLQLHIIGILSFVHV